MKKYIFELTDINNDTSTITLDAKCNSAAESLGMLNGGRLKFSMDVGHYANGKKKTKMVEFKPEGKHRIERFYCGQYSILEWEGKII